MTVLIASSPVEIEAKADEAGLPAEAHDIARDLFHDLTNRIGQAVVALDVAFQDWPQHRFYFAADATALDRLLTLLKSRKDILDVTDAVPSTNGTISGLFAQSAEAGYTAILVAHETHDGH